MKTVRYIHRNLILGLVLMGLAICHLINLYYALNAPNNPFYLPMKQTTFISLCIAGCLAIAITFIACGGTDRRTVTEYSILIDETDSTFAIPTADELYSDLGLDTNIWNGVNFTLARIEDVSYTPRSSFSLSKGGSRLASNEYVRKGEVDGFRTRITELLDSVRKDTSGRPNSSIGFQLANELTRLANNAADRKVLVVYSDLMEHRTGLSFYDKQTFALLRSDPEKVEEQLFAGAKLPNLNGIEVRLIYEPKNTHDDAVFHVVSEFYKALLESKGATVVISANLSHP